MNGHKSWIIGALAIPLLLGIFGAFTSTFLKAVDRIGALEANYENLNQSIQRMESKLDRLLFKSN